MDENKGYDMDNFDDSKTVVTQGGTNPKKKAEPDDKKLTETYGDGFSDGFADDNIIYSSDNSDYFAHDKDSFEKKKRSNRNIAIIFAVAAIVCLSVALVFVFAQCNSKENTDASLPSRPTAATSASRATTVTSGTSEIQTQPQETSQEATEVSATTAQSQVSVPESDVSNPDSGTSTEISESVVEPEEFPGEDTPGGDSDEGDPETPDIEQQPEVVEG